MDDGSARIELRRKSGPSMWAVVDEGDRELVGQYRWTAMPNGSTYYAITRPAGRTLYMHRLILQVPNGLEIDHADRDGLNNRRGNLRLATRTENLRNCGPRITYAGRAPASRFKGVSRNVCRHVTSWVAKIQVDGRRESLGSYPSEEAAARAYDRRAREAFGKFAVLNFPDESAA